MFKSQLVLSHNNIKGITLKIYKDELKINIKANIKNKQNYIRKDIAH